MMQQVIPKGKHAPAGWIITQGISSSGVCQDPNGCYAESNSDSSAVPQPIVQPNADASQDMALRPASTAQMLGLPPQPAKPLMCTPEAGCQPATVNLGGSAQRVTGIPDMNPGFTAASGTDPYEVWRARQWMHGFGSNQDANKAVATAGVAASHNRASELMAQGVDYQTAIGLAQREAMDASGYRAAGIASGATPATTGLIDRAAQLEAERQYMRGGAMSNAARALLPASPGTIFIGPDGRVYQSGTTANAQQLDMGTRSAADPFTAAALLSGQRGLPLERAKTDQSSLARFNLQELRNTGNLERVMQQGADRLAVAQVRQANRTNRTWRDRLDPQSLAAAEAAYAESGGENTGVPFEAYYRAWIKQKQGEAGMLTAPGAGLSGF